MGSIGVDSPVSATLRVGSVLPLSRSATGRAFLAFQELFEMRDRLLHHFGRLQHERQNEFAAAEPVADVLHGGQQNLVEHVHRAALLQREVDLGLDAVFAAPQDRVVNPLGDGQALFGIFRDRSVLADALALEAFDEAGQRVGAAVHDQIVAQFAHVRVEFEIRRDVFGMHERAVESGFDAVVQKNGIERRARGRLEAERNVGHAQRREHARKLALDRADALDRRDRRIREFRVPGRQRKREVVEDERSRRDAVLADDDVVNAFGDFELALDRLGHAHFVYGQRDDRGAVFDRERQHDVHLRPARLEVHGIDDRASRIVL